MSDGVLVAACDAGSANWLAPVLPRLGVPWRLFAQGPARDIFSAHKMPFTGLDPCDWCNIPVLGQQIVGSGRFQAVLTGTSWGACVEKAVVLAAREADIPTLSGIDHWVLFRERFSRVESGRIVSDDLVYMPDKVLVADEEARNIAIAAGLPQGSLIAAGHPHLEVQRDFLARKIDNRGDEYVFVSERLSVDHPKGSPLDLGFDEYDALRGVAQALPRDARLTIKLHPQDDADKYNAIVPKIGIFLDVVGQCDIGELIAKANRVIGMRSMLLLEAALVRNDVISFLPGRTAHDFVGNRIGATLFADSADKLKLLLRNPGKIAPNPRFGDKFRGSSDRICAIVRESIRCG